MSHSPNPSQAAPTATTKGRVLFGRDVVPGVLLIIGDFLLLPVTLALAVLIRMQADSWIPIEISDQMVQALLLANLTLPLGYWAAGLYPGYGLNAVERLRIRSTVTFLGFGAMIVFDHLALKGQWSRGILITQSLLALVFLPTWDEIIIKLLLRLKIWGQAVIIIGPPPARQTIAHALRSNPELGWIPVAEADPGAPVGPDGAELSIALVSMSVDGMGSWLGIDHLPYRRVILIPDIDCLQTQWVTARSLGPYLALQVQQNLLLPSNQTIKRGFDIAAALLLLLLAAPAMAMAALLIVLVSPGPVFYAQIRAGRDGRPFKMWKLRTMVVDADRQLAQTLAASPEARESWEKAVKIPNDPRILPWIGTIFRKYSIDELPQFWNVIRGEMSLVGPRPLPDYHTERLPTLANQLRQRVRPGITGLWQISGRGDVSTHELQRLDIHYVRNWSLWLDLHILLRTIGTVLGGRGAH